MPSYISTKLSDHEGLRRENLENMREMARPEDEFFVELSLPESVAESGRWRAAYR